MQDREIPRNIMADLKCFLCSKYLSVLPVKINRNNHFICGRAHSEESGNNEDEEDENYINVDIYEKLAQLLVFPCIYDDCKEKLKSNQVSNHEEVCSYRTITCPAECEETVSKHSIVKHFLQLHGINCYRDGKVELRFDMKQESFTKVCLVSLKGSYYFAFIGVEHTINKKLCKVHVFSLNCNTNSKFIVSLMRFSNGLREYYFSETKTTSKFDKLMLNREFFASVSGQELQFDPAKENWGQIEIQLKESLYADDSQKTVMEEKLECPVCNNLMTQEIRLCTKGHSFCGECRSQINHCPLCREAIGDTRNYLLENIAEIFLSK